MFVFVGQRKHIVDMLFSGGLYFYDSPHAYIRHFFHCKTLYQIPLLFQITLYDTAGMERFEGTIPPTYFRSARAVILVYSISSTDSINNIESWMESITPQRLEYVGHIGEILRVIVGNKVRG